MKKEAFIYFTTLFALILGSSFLFAQVKNEDEDIVNFLSNESMTDTKSLQKYYQNVFRDNQKKTIKDIIPSFDIDKEELLKKLKEAVPIEGPIDPSLYFVGPGDIIEVNVWSSIPFSFTTNINPEGSIIIPSVGEIQLKNKTLLESKQIVKKKVQEKYIGGEITTNLISPRIFSVNVAGVVNNPGSYYANAVQRVDQVLYLANLKLANVENSLDQTQNKKRELLNRPEFIQYFNDDMINENELKFSLRNILLIRAKSDTIHVDLQKYYSTGNTLYNPTLKDGDCIIVQNEKMQGNSITISGAVRIEGQYEYVENDSIKSIFEIVQGPTENADLENVELYRMNKSDGKFNLITINLTSILADQSPNMALKPNDRIVIRELYPRIELANVTIKGEVKYPGLYPINITSTTLTEIINACGGFTDRADLRNAKVLRFPTNLDPAQDNPDYQRLTSMKSSDLDKDQREYYNYEYAVKRNTLSVDFQKLFIENDSHQNLNLEDGDIILVPSYSKTVYIYGQVARTGYLDYKEEYEYEDYIRLAGGYSLMAEEGEVKIVKAGSFVWMDPSDTTIEPGDAIFIPREKDRDFEYYFNWFSKIIGVVSGVATIYLLLQK